jgi:hypothetical protein
MDNFECIPEQLASQYLTSRPWKIDSKHDLMLIGNMTWQCQLHDHRSRNLSASTLISFRAGECKVGLLGTYENDILPEWLFHEMSNVYQVVVDRWNCCKLWWAWKGLTLWVRDLTNRRASSCTLRRWFVHFKTAANASTRYL